MVHESRVAYVIILYKKPRTVYGLDGHPGHERVRAKSNRISRDFDTNNAIQLSNKVI